MERGQERWVSRVAETDALFQIYQKGTLKTQVPGMTLLFPNFCLKICPCGPIRAPVMISLHPGSFYPCFLRQS